MNTPECDNLDAYLCGWLSEEEAASFEAHLADCAACRQEAEQQRRIDELLAQGAGRVEAIPSSLVDGIERRIRRLRRRRMVRLAWATSAAAVLVLAVGVYLTTRYSATPGEPQAIVERQPEPAAGDAQISPPSRVALNDRPAVRVRLEDPSEAILVPLETSNPNVSIVWIYPTVRPAQAQSAPAGP